MAILNNAANVLFGNKAISIFHTSLSVPRSGINGAESTDKANALGICGFKCCLKGRAWGASSQSSGDHTVFLPGGMPALAGHSENVQKRTGDIVSKVSDPRLH